MRKRIESHQTSQNKRFKQLKLFDINKSCKPYVYKSNNDTEQSNLLKCKDISLHESVKKSYLQKYKQNLSVARHYLLKLEVDLKEAKKIDKAALDSEIEKDISTEKQANERKEILQNGSFDDIHQKIFPFSIILKQSHAKPLFNDFKDTFIKLLNLEKLSIKLYPSSSVEYFDNLFDNLENLNEIEVKKNLLKKVCQLENFLFSHPDDRDLMNPLFDEGKKGVDIKVDKNGIIELL